MDDAGTVLRSRWRRNASIVIATTMGIIFAYGLIRFPDAPLHSCVEHDYCGKQGQPHTRKDFEQFEIWQNTLFCIWPIGMLALFFLNRDRIRPRRRS
jgi:hypothetical protein